MRPDSGTNKYFLEYYNKDDCEFFDFEKQSQSYMMDPVYTEVVYIRGRRYYFDVISDSMLLNKLNDSIDINLLSSNPEEFERLYSTSPFLSDIPDEIRITRIKKVQSILTKTSDYDEAKKKALYSLIDSVDDKFLIKRIQESKLFKELQEQITELQNEKSELSDENNKLKDEYKKLALEVDRLNETSLNTNALVIDTEKIDELEKENSMLKEKISLVDNYEKLKEDYDQKKKLYDNKVEEINEKNKEISEKDKELKKIKEDIQNFITVELNKIGTTKMLHTAFDPCISSAMMEAAGNYRVDTEADKYKTIFEEMQEFKCPEFNKADLINLLVDGIQKFRKYSKNEILNMFICISQNFLTVFSGEPGTGKTSICNIIASILGLNKFGKNNNISRNRYVPVSVERGWVSKRDLIGYFNPLTKQYDRNNSKIYDGLMILNEERDKSRFPYLILLDEANLSPIEYYWTDFMRATDSSESDIYIDIGLDKDIYIPKTLHFLATINNDQTTEQLSPRLIDRAWIIKLPKQKEIIESTVNSDDYFDDIILWSDIEKTFSFSESKEISLRVIMDKIYSLFDEHHLSVSPRVQQSMKNYICVAQEIMEDEIGVCDKKQKALDFAIVQKLLPKISGYYKDYERLFKSLTGICDENHLIMTKEALISMQEYQEQNMGYCQYLV